MRKNVALKHNKKTNLGLISEYLMQEILESIIQKDKNKRKKLLEIYRKYFLENLSLQKEYGIFLSLLNEEYKNREDAKKFIVETFREMENLKKTSDERKTSKQKLLEEIYSVCDKDTFFNHNIKNYNTYATINLLIDYYSKNKNLNEIKNLIDLEKTLLEHIVSNKVIKQSKTDIEDLLDKQKSLNEAEMMIAVSKLQSSYFNKLNKEQKELLEFYVKNFSDDMINNKLDKHYRTNFNKLRGIYLSESIKDINIKNKLKEALNLFKNNYESSEKSVRDKLKIVLDSYFVIEDFEKK